MCYVFVCMCLVLKSYLKYKAQFREYILNEGCVDTQIYVGIFTDFCRV